MDVGSWDHDKGKGKFGGKKGGALWGKGKGALGTPYDPYYGGKNSEKGFGKAGQGKSGDPKGKGKGKPWHSGKSKGKGFHGYCNYCGMYGHKASDCFRNPAKGKGRKGQVNSFEYIEEDPNSEYYDEAYYYQMLEEVNQNSHYQEDWNSGDHPGKGGNPEALHSHSAAALLPLLCHPTATPLALYWHDTATHQQPGTTAAQIFPTLTQAPRAPMQRQKHPSSPLKLS